MMKETTLVVYMSCNKYVKIIASPEVNTFDKKYVKKHSKNRDVLCKKRRENRKLSYIITTDVINIEQKLRMIFNNNSMSVYCN
jgi:hypothetical protein